MPQNFENRPKFNTESTLADAYDPTPSPAGEEGYGSDGGFIRPSRSVGGSPAQEFNPNEHHTDRTNLPGQRPISGGGAKDFTPDNIDSYNVLP